MKNFLNNKIITKNDLHQITLTNKRITLAYGHFNVLHPGHLRFLQYAHELGDCLVVVVIGDRIFEEKQKQITIEKNQIRSCFSEQERSEGVAALQAVDWVIILDNISFVKIISILQPSFFVLGKEHEEKKDDEIKKYINEIKKYGGKTIFRSGDVRYAGTDLLFFTQDEILKKTLKMFQEACQKHSINLKNLYEKISAFKNQDILIIGDSIVDQYIACDALGMSAEAPVVTIRELETKEFIGGASIVACHVKTLGANCHYISVVGDDKAGLFIHEKLNSYGIDTNTFTDKSRPTTFKIRYLVDNQKMLRVSRLKEHSISNQLEKKIIKHIELLAPQLDGIIISDFVYGVITNKLLEKIVGISEKNQIKLFGDLQCSSQVGNVCKFKQFDLITPTEREARIAMSDHEHGLEKLSRDVIKYTKSKNLLVTLGRDGFIAYQQKKQNDNMISQHFPALNSNSVDASGAGDSLLATMATGLCAGLSLMEAAALGSCSAAITVGRIGNIPISHAELRQYIKKTIQQIDVI